MVNCTFLRPLYYSLSDLRPLLKPMMRTLFNTNIRAIIGGIRDGSSPRNELSSSHFEGVVILLQQLIIKIVYTFHKNEPEPGKKEPGSRPCATVQCLPCSRLTRNHYQICQFLQAYLKIFAVNIVALQILRMIGHYNFNIYLSFINYTNLY